MNSGLTDSHVHQIQQRISQIELQAKLIASLLADALEDSDPLVIRAGEIAAAIQRLRWALDRGSVDKATGSAGAG
jgi:hypothetical protein